MDIQNDQRQQKQEKKGSGKARVKVAIRVRPLIPKQVANNENTCVQFRKNNQIILGKERNYKFDHVFSAETLQSTVYSTCVHDLVMGCFEGYNAAILAYGQTGSGKTFTMGTALSTLTNAQEQGIIPRVIQQIFKQAKLRQKQSQFIIKVSFLEIYNEQILDLLTDPSDKNNKNRDQTITIREEKDGSVSLVNINEEQVTSSEQMMELLERGGYHRTTASTLMNDTSSRSHAIFTIFIEQHKIDDLYKAENQKNNSNKNTEVDDGFTTAKFFFVDLAGSERAKKTGATGATLKEGININMGLLQLGNVISALSTIQKKQEQFITYRNSKLTRILQSCLGGNSNTYMIACISPAQSNFEQSLNSLKYASKAMNIKNKPIKNIDPHTAQITQFKQKIHELEVQNRKLKSLLSEKGINVQDKSLTQSPDIVSEELKKMKKLYIGIQKKYEEAVNQLRQQRKNKGQIQIQLYTSRREKDILALKLQESGVTFKDEQSQRTNTKLGILNQLSDKIEKLESELRDKQNINNQLQKQYEKMEQINQKDQKMLISKNTVIYELVKQNQSLRKNNAALKAQIQHQGDHSEYMTNNDKSVDYSASQKQFEQSVLDEVPEYFQSLSPQTLQLLAPELKQRESILNKQSLQTEEQLKSITQMLMQKQNHLQQISKSQINLEYQLIEEMKEEYHSKIAMLQKQKSQLIKMKDQSKNMNPQDKNKYINKIDNLETELKQFRKKIREQKNLQKLANNQSGKIKELATQIRKFKMQKGQLSRKLKQDKDGFNKFRAKKVKQLVMAKKQNIKKDNQIRKMNLQNNRKNQIFKKKQQELNRAKRINETLKNIVKPPTFTKKTNQSQSISSHNPSFVGKASNSIQNTVAVISQKKCQEHIQHCIKLILSEIDQQKVIAKYQNKLKELNQEIAHFLNEDSHMKLKLQRLIIKQQSYQQNGLNEAEEEQRQQLQLNLNDLKERLANAEDSLHFCNQKYNQLLEVNSEIFFDIDNQIFYRKQYESLENLKIFIKVLIASLRTILADNYSLYQIKETLELQTNNLKQIIAQLKQKLQSVQIEHQYSLQKLRQQMLTRYYSNNSGQQQSNSPSASMNTYKRMEERDKKNFQKKIVDLTKTNRQISHEVQLWKRKCVVVQQKYQSIRSLLSKDRGIGLNPKQKNPAEQKKKGLTRVSSMIDQVNDLALQLDTKMRKNNSNEDHIHIHEKLERQTIVEKQQFDYSTNQWECLGKIDAHSSAVLSIATHANMLISTSTKSLKIWDLQTSKIISDLSGAHLTGLVKYVMVDPQRNIMLTACEKVVTIWDLITLNVECSLKAHKDEVRTMHIANDLLFTGGKGLANSGSLLMWDLRCLDPNKPQEQKQRNQDIFTFASKGNILYYGTRNHHVRRLDMNSLEVLSPFEPPHMDTVTGLAVIQDRMVSGSKDKNLRLWSLQHSVGNLKSTTHAFNDYVTTVKNDRCYPIFYSGSKDGQVKVGHIKNDRIIFHGGILAHTQSVNAISPLQDSNTIVTASADKTIKIWRPNLQSSQKMQKDFM